MDPGFYPVEQNLIEGARHDETAIFLVDVGGSKGHYLQELYQKHPRLPGKLVLQDLDALLKEAQASGTDPKLVYMVHDLFTEQPIKGLLAIMPQFGPKIDIYRNTSLLYALRVA